MPTVSVIMASYNCPRYIEAALESIRKQTFKDFEVIIADESTDGTTREILKAFAKKDARFKPYYLKGLGLSGSLNFAIKKARGEFIARMDADDICLPKRLEKQVAYLRAHKELDLIGSWAYLIDKNGARIGKITSPPKDDATFRRRFLVTGPWVSPTLMWRRAMHKRTGYFDPSFRHAEDYEFMSRCLPKIMVGNIQEFLLEYRWDFSQNLTFTAGKKTEWNAIRVRYRMIRRGDAPMWKMVYLAKPLVSYLIPTSVKKYILTTIGATPKHG